MMWFRRNVSSASLQTQPQESSADTGIIGEFVLNQFSAIEPAFVMELAHSLLLNEEALKRISENKRPVFVFEWLRFLDKVLVAAQKSDINESQKKLVAQLTNQITESPGPPTRKLLARCLATLFSVGDTFELFETINFCNSIIKNKDDSPSYLPTRLAAVAAIGAMYEKLGRMVGRSFEETIQLLIKALKNAESQGRCEIMLTLQKVLLGLGSAGSACHKDIYKAAKNCMNDRSMTVRCAAAKCLSELVNQAPFTYSTETENMVSLCFRAMDGSNYDVRCSVAKLLAQLLAAALNPKSYMPGKAANKRLGLDDVFNLLSTGFLRGGMGFLKGSTAGEIMKGGGSGVNREVRVGVTHSYVEFVKAMGGLWLERNLADFLNHVLCLVLNPRATPTHVDAVYARKCVNFILRQTIGGLLGEKAQTAAAREICAIIVKYMNASGDAIFESVGEKSSDGSTTQHVLVCALQELGSLVQRLGTSASRLLADQAHGGIIEPVMSVLIHPCACARLTAAWCLRCIAVALPSQMTPLLDHCMSRMHQLKSSPEAISGYSFAVAALLGGVQQCTLGIPHAKGKQIFAIAEELLRTATQNSRLSLQRTQAGWLLLGALMTLGPPVIRNHLPRMLLLWRNAFPRSTKELEAEKMRGDAFTWQVTLEARSGALCAMQSFISHCQELVTEDVTRRLMPPLECALTMMGQMNSIIKMYGAHLKASAAMVRVRLYGVLLHLPPETFEGAYNALLRELVAEFTLTDNPANTTTSLLRSMCHVDDSVILGSWLQETDHKAIEDQLQPNSASGSGALEHDAAYLFIKNVKNHRDESIPGPLPLGVAVIDRSVRLYGAVFPRVAHKHRLQMLEHFGECIKQAKSARQQAVQINIFTAVLCALKNLAESKGIFGQNDVRKAAIQLVLGALSSSNPILRCTAGEALGRMSQVIGENKFIAEMAQYSFDKLKAARDVVTRTGHSFALGCLHRYVGGMGAGQHLNTSVSILLALAQDSTSPVVQVWALHALGLIADSGGPMFRGYVEPTLSLVLTLLLTVPPSNVDVHQCLGKCLGALITTIGPEMQGNTSAVATARLSCLVCCAIMQDHSDSLVQAEAISCLQQLHMFAPRHVNLSSLVPHLCETLNSSHLLLRRAAVACLRQLSQREAKEVSEHALMLATDPKDAPKDQASLGRIVITELGLEGALFQLLDLETDNQLCSNVRDTLISMLQSMATTNLKRWLCLLREVLSASSESSSLDEEVTEGDVDEKDDEVEDSKFKAAEAEMTHPTVAPRWPTRVFAIECLRRINQACEGDETNYDLIKAKESKDATSKDYLVLHLSELIRMAFIAATSDSDKLRLAGLATLQDIVSRFATVPEPEFPGHVILEQYQAQVGAALRPAFAPETSSDVTAAACEVCSSWIGSGVARDLNDLRRVHQLLVSSLAKLKNNKGQSQLYSESASTMEKLAVLRAWAEVYIVAMQREDERKNQLMACAAPSDGDDLPQNDYCSGESLLSLVQPELVSLSKHWLDLLKDYALLSLPPELHSQLPPEGGAFYNSETRDTARPHYKRTWPAVLHACTLWLSVTGFTTNHPSSEGCSSTSVPANMNPDDVNSDRFHLILGICVEALCNPTSTQPVETVSMCLHALYSLLSTTWPRAKLMMDNSLAIELLNVMHRLLLTRELSSTHPLVVNVVKQVVKAAHEDLEKAKQRDPRAEPVDADDQTVALIGEGGESGDIVPGQSVSFAVMEVCLCILIHQLPAINPANPSTGFQVPSRLGKLSEESILLICSAVQIMAELPTLCSPAGSISILPSILYLMTSVLRELSTSAAVETNCPTCTTAVLQSLKSLVVCPIMRDPLCIDDWVKLLQSTMVSLLDMAKPDEEREMAAMDRCTLMLTLTVFILSCPPEVVCVPNVRVPCTEIYIQAWDSTNPQERLKCVQTVASIFQHPDRTVSTPYIHSLSPRFIELLYATSMNGVTSEQDLNLALECIRAAETLVGITDEGTRINMASLFVPLLISFLLDDTKLATASRLRRQLHDHALQRLMAFGPMYPENFRTIMSSIPDLRTRLEAAIRAKKSDQAREIEKKPTQAVKSSVPAKPTITLKTDFSNFTG
ncbi:HEAT repeat-containing protein 5B-like [Tubulanus polymorphus]|uniref:HEAT repeat-containing protein 5B-like n=1 Tax=Tubulanus polymorphus TaxID=672921 RepID=UPI003DA4114E